MISDDSREERLAQIYADCSDRINRGEAVELEKILTANQDLGPELEEALRILGQLQRLKKECSQSEKSEDPSAETALGLPSRFGDFEIIRKLGQGGMGEVYLARQVSLARQVAIKIVSSSIA